MKMPSDWSLLENLEDAMSTTMTTMATMAVVDEVVLVHFVTIKQTNKQ